MNSEAPVGDRGSATGSLENDAKIVASSAVLPVSSGGIPHELRMLRRWGVWVAESRPTTPGRFAKVPIDARTRFPVDGMNSAYWMQFDEALALWSTDTRISGIGVAMLPRHVMLDLDSVRDPATENLKPWAAELVDQCASYVEVSVSGMGVHIWLTGEWKGIREWQGIEVKRNAFTPITGLRLPGASRSIKPNQAALALLEESPRHRVAKRFVTDRAFRALHKGQTPSKYSSRERADDAFALMLFWMFDSNREEVERAIRRSRRFRTNWDDPANGGPSYLTVLLDTAEQLHRIERQERALAEARDPVALLRRKGGRATETRKRVLRALSGLEAPVFALAISQMTGSSRSGTQHCLRGLVDLGVVRRTPSGYVLSSPLMSSNSHSPLHSPDVEIIDIAAHREQRRSG